MKKPDDPEKPVGPYGQAWRNMASNLSIILGERAVFGLVNLAAVALATRAMPLEQFGLVVMLLAFARLWGAVLKFQGWKAVLTYGQPMLDREDRDGFRRLIGFLLMLDLCAIVIAVGVAWASIGLVARLMDWPPEVTAMAPWYALLLIFVMPSTPVGLLRLLNRFSVLAWQHALNAVVRFAGAGLILIFGGGAEELAVAWGAAIAISGGYMIFTALREAARRGLSPDFSAGWSAAKACPGIWRFVGVTNLNSTLENTLTHATVLIVGGFLGAADTALLAIARQVTDVLTKLGSLLGPIIFPEIARMHSRGQRSSLAKLISRTVIFSGVALGGVVLALVFAGEMILTTLFNAEAAEAYEFLVLSGAASSALALSISFEPAMLSAGRVASVLWTGLGALLIFAVIVLATIPVYGLVGVGAALLARSLFLTVSRAVITYRELRRR